MQSAKNTTTPTVGAFLRGTRGENNSGVGYKSGTKRHIGSFYFSWGGQAGDEIQRVVLCKSPIDALSYLTLDSLSCGILRIRASAIYKDSDRFEVQDKGTGKKYALDYSKLEVGDTPSRCNGEVVSGNKAWKSSDGRTIFITGLTPGRGQTIRILSQDVVRRLTTNFCGYFRFKLDDNPPAAIIVGGEAFPTNTTATGRGLACRYAKKYVSFPPPPEVQKEPEEQWKQENPVPFSDGAVTVDSSGTTGTTSSNNEPPFQLSQPEPNYYLVNGAFVIANRPQNGEILGDFIIENEDYEKLKIYGSAGLASCGRQQLPLFCHSPLFTNIRKLYWFLKSYR